MQPLLLTGANGFVGQHLLAYLSQALDCHIFAASRQQCAPFPGVSTLKAPDLGPEADWSGLPGEVETVIHTASRAHVMGEKPAAALPAYRRVNVEGTRALLEACAGKGVRRFIYLSSIKAVGESSLPGHPLHEESTPQPGDAYGRSKRETEELIQKVCREAGISFTILRLPLLYGAGMKGNLPGLARLAAKPLPLPFGLLTRNRRSLLGVENLQSFLLACLHHPKAHNEVFHLADAESLSTRALVEILARAQGRKPGFIPVPEVLLKLGLGLIGKSEMARRLTGSLEVDHQKACALLDWSPPQSIREGLAKALANP